MSKTILMTGCSSGFGKLAVPLLLQRGHTVIAAMRGGEERLRSTFGRELAAYPGRLLSVDLHMEKPESMEAAVAIIRDRFGGRLDALINNAGYGLFGALEDTSAEELRYQLEVNFVGPALLTRSLLPALRQAHGRIINLSSIAGRSTFPFYGSYCATKYAVEGLTEAIRFELKAHGVQATLIEPGGFRTDFSTRSRVFAAGSLVPASPYHARIRSLERAFEETSSRLGDPMKVAKLIARLCDKPRLKPRYLIGADAKLLAAMDWLLPASWREGILNLVFRKAVFKD